MNTFYKILFLQKYIRKHHAKLFELSPEKIVGIRIDKKKVRTDSKATARRRPYAIVFQVDTKVKDNRLKNSRVLPKYLKVKFPDGLRKIPTDVEATGRPSFHLSKCLKPLANGTLDRGVIGLYLTDNNGECYALTNYHVAAFERMKQGEFIFEGSDKDITIDGQQADFEDGILSDELDIAFIKCPHMDGVDHPNRLNQNMEIDGFVPGPITPDFKNKIASVFIGLSNRERKVTINDNSAIFDTGFNGIKLLDVIQITPRVTIKGDSGSPVVIDDAILGIITGGDKKFSYVIPYHKIRNFKKLDIP